MGGWACRDCGDAYFSEPPDTGLCTTCRQHHDKTDNSAYLNLAERNVLIGGQISTGKTAVIQLVAAHDTNQPEGSTWS